MKYTIKIANDAINDLTNIYNYIAITLASPVSASRQYSRISKGVLSLKYFPERIKIFDPVSIDTPNLRRLLVDNYSIFFTIRNNTVTVTNILYTSSNITERLSK